MKKLLSLALPLLLACSSNAATGPKSPGEKLLADRIEALEADIAQLSAEMQELRIEYLPLEELSEDEFTRYIEKRVATVAPEDREALEKKLRAKRKTATLEGKALEEYWDNRFDTAEPDEAWAKGAEASCKPLVEKAMPQNSKLLAFQCKKESCRYDVEIASEGAAVDDVINACTADAENFSTAMVTRRTTKSNARTRATVFVARKGVKLEIQ